MRSGLIDSNLFKLWGKIYTQDLAVYLESRRLQIISNLLKNIRCKIFFELGELQISPNLPKTGCATYIWVSKTQTIANIF